MSDRPVLAASHVHGLALAAIAGFHADTVREVQAAVARDPIVVVGMAQNPFVKRARKALDKAGLTFTYLEYGSYMSAWKPRLAVKLWSGWPTFPQVFVRGTLIGGFEDLQRGLAEGTVAALLATEATKTEG
jgi:monothiol glutaredoxin